MPKISEILKEARLRRGLSQEKLGALVGKTGAAISQFEAGMKEPRMDTLYKLVKALDLIITLKNNSIMKTYVKRTAPTKMAMPWTGQTNDLHFLKNRFSSEGILKALADDYIGEKPKGMEFKVRDSGELEITQDNIVRKGVFVVGIGEYIVQDSVESVEIYNDPKHFDAEWVLEDAQAEPELEPAS